MTISVSDGTDTYVFTETQRDVDYVMFHNLLDPANANAPFDLIERRKLSLAVRRPKGGALPDGTNRNSRVQLHLERPVLKEVPSGSGNSSGYTPPASVDHRVVCNVEFILPAQTSDADIAQIVAMTKNALIVSEISDAVKLRSTSGVT